jgi:hypothetical protein
MDELRKEDAMAAAVFMYWSVLLHRLDGMWWCQSTHAQIIQLAGTLANAVYRQHSHHGETFVQGYSVRYWT